MALNTFKKIAINPIINFLGKNKVKSKFSDTPIIICGCGRSGTTLLLSIIGAHPKIYALSKETTTFANWKRVNKDSNLIYKPERLDRFYRDILVNKIPKGVTRWCEKTPNNVHSIDKIIDYFNGDVQFIHIIRDGRDVMLSKHPVDPDKYWVSPKRWVNDVKAGLKFKDNPKIITIKYEDLILNYQEFITKICNFIGEECTEELYNWFEHTNVKKSKAWSDKVQNIHSKSIEKWKKEENEKRVQEIMQNKEVVNLLEELDYL